MSIEIIYTGGYIPDLGVETDINNRFFGWLLMKHPDGQWVTVANLKQVAATITSVAVAIASIKEELKNSFVEGYQEGGINALESLEQTLLAHDQKSEKVLFALNLVRQCKKVVVEIVAMACRHININ